VTELPFGFHVEEPPYIAPFDGRTPVFNEAEIHACFDDLGKSRAQITCGYCADVFRGSRKNTVDWFLAHECASPYLAEHILSAGNQDDWDTAA
jgi:hypothetical protein